MKPNNQDMEVKTPKAVGARPVLHGRVRFGRFLIGGVALVAMVAVAMFSGNPLSSSNEPLLASPESTTNPNPGETKDVLEPAGPGLVRLGGGGATAYAVEISKQAYPYPGVKEAYLVPSYNAVDAFAASVLDGPVYLVPNTGAMPSSVAEEIRRVNPEKLYVLGGPGVISPSLPPDIDKKTERIYGSTRVETAIAIARHAFPNGADTVYVTNGLGGRDMKGSADAAGAGVLKGGPIVNITNAASAYQVAPLVAALHPRQVIALGGPAVVPDSALNIIAGGIPHYRWGGADRFQTSTIIASMAKQQMRSQGITPSKVFLVPGFDLSYALVTGSIDNGVILMTRNSTDYRNRQALDALGLKEADVFIGAPEHLISTSAAQVTVGALNPVSETNRVNPSQLYCNYSLHPTQTDADREVFAFEAVNQIRAQHGLPALQNHPVIQDAARAWAQRMARTGVFEHSSSVPSMKYANLYPSGWRWAAENIIAYWKVSPAKYGQGVADMWYRSDKGHRDNMLSSRATHTGVGVATGAGYAYAVQDFAQY